MTVVPFWQEDGMSNIFHNLFDFDGEPVRFVYTCRSRIEKVPCPTYYESNVARLKNAFSQHVPVDEFMTLQLMLHWYRDQIWRKSHQEIIERFSCSFPLDMHEELLPDHEPSIRIEQGNRAQLPEFVFDNLIIVGENSCANLMLDRLKHLLNFYPRFFKPITFQPNTLIRPRVNIDLSFMPNNPNTIDPSDEENAICTRFDEATNAVAMICYAPNPFNVQKKVLILYGCHRVGQYLLERWLNQDEAAAILGKILENRSDASPAFGQIVLNGGFSESSGEYKFTDFHVIHNHTNELPFFPFAVRSKRIVTHGFEIDYKPVQQNPMVDISLIIELAKHNSQLTGSIDRFFRKELPSLNDQYWESAQTSDIGLHVTLFEFATHETHQTLSEGIEQFNILAQKLPNELYNELANELNVVRSPRLSLIGCDVFPQSIVLYADLPVSFLDVVRRICHRYLPKNRYFNRMRMPFPLHCTIIRFTRELKSEEQQQLMTFADKYRRHEFGEFYVQTLSLLLAQREPYQEAPHQVIFELPART